MPVRMRLCKHDCILCIKTASGCKRILVWALRQASLKINRIASSIPGLNAQERCFLSFRRPQSKQRRIKAYRHIGFAVAVQD